jgi:hypothetical protein
VANFPKKQKRKRKTGNVRPAQQPAWGVRRLVRADQVGIQHPQLAHYLSWQHSTGPYLKCWAECRTALQMPTPNLYTASSVLFRIFSPKQKNRTSILRISILFSMSTSHENTLCRLVHSTSSSANHPLRSFVPR